MHNNVIVIRSEFLTSAVNPSQFPSDPLPQIAFIGRSNVGKSSLINSLSNRKNLARVSSMPGKTQTINFYKLSLKLHDSRLSFFLVDLPGYGYAKTSKSNRKLWQSFIEQFLLNSSNIKFVCLLIDIRHPPKDSDINMLHWLLSLQLPVLIVATKSDKLSRSLKSKQLSLIHDSLGIAELPVLPYSSFNNEGRSLLLDVIADSLL